MTVICSTMSPKGGCGKTPTAISLAGHLRRCGYKTAILDADPQNAVINWLARRMDSDQMSEEDKKLFADVAPFPIKLSLGADAYLKSQYPDHDFIIIDTQGDLKAVHQNILMASHLVISPVFAVEAAIDGVISTAEFVSDAQEIRGDWPVMVVARVKWKKGGVNERAGQKRLDKLQKAELITTLDSITSDTAAAYNYVLNDGHTLWEGANVLPKSHRSKFEVAEFQQRKQLKELTGILESIKLEIDNG